MSDARDQISAMDKIGLAAFLETASVGVAELKAALPLVEDDGLRKLVDAALAAGEVQIKGVQEFCHAHGLA